MYDVYINKRVFIIIKDGHGFYNGIVKEVNETHLLLDDDKISNVLILLSNIAKIELRGVDNE
jgi:hypothetical protein